MRSPSNHSTHRGPTQAREATRGRPGPPKCPPRAAMLGEVHISFVLTLSTRRFRGAVDGGAPQQALSSVQSVFMYGNTCFQFWASLIPGRNNPQKTQVPGGTSSQLCLFWRPFSFLHPLLLSADIFVSRFSQTWS